MLVGDTKTYEVVLLLGVTTDTQDVGGNIRERRPVFCTEEDVRRCLKTFLGEQHQIPPMYSALKQNGKKLYEMAREGKEVERVARPVHFYEITVMKIDLPRVWLRATCSKGTYIRTFCHDIGEALGCGGCMEHLIRTKVGTFEWKNTFKLHQVKFLADQGRLEDCILPIDKMFNSLPALQVEPQGNKLAWNGGYLYPQQIRGSENPPNWTDGSDYRVYDSKRVFVGIYR